MNENKCMQGWIPQKPPKQEWQHNTFTACLHLVSFGNCIVFNCHFVHRRIVLYMKSSGVGSAEGVVHIVIYGEWVMLGVASTLSNLTQRYWACHLLHLVYGSMPWQPFSGFSVGSCINEEEGYLLPTWALKISWPMFHQYASVVSWRKWRSVKKCTIFSSLRIPVIGGQRLVGIAPPSQAPHFFFFMWNWPIS